MEKCKKVYIKGNIKKGNEIIKLLENLGGCNTLSYTGINDDVWYFINPDGIISLATPTLFSYLIKAHYKEIKLPRWKPKNEECYYFIDDRGTIITSMWNKYGERKDNLRYEFGNCFRTPQEAEAVSNKIKGLLNNR